MLRLFFSFSSSSSPFLAFQRDLFLPPSKPRNFSHKWIRSIIGPDMPSALGLVLKSVGFLDSGTVSLFALTSDLTNSETVAATL